MTKNEAIEKIMERIEEIKDKYRILEKLSLETQKYLKLYCRNYFDLRR